LKFIDQLGVKLHKSEIKDQIKKRWPTSRLTFEFVRDAIELILKIKITIEDLIEQIKN